VELDLQPIQSIEPLKAIGNPPQELHENAQFPNAAIGDIRSKPQQTGWE
jgi:hypothetical protein